MLLDPSFYRRNNVVTIARELLGKGLFTRSSGKLTGGIIVETEAYSSVERGSHAYNNRRTLRNEVMFGDGGHAYVYLCYGIHHLFNVVTNKEGKADAVLVRALEPMEGIDQMLKRMNTREVQAITSGPGKLTKALGIGRDHNGENLRSKYLWLEDLGQVISRKKIESGPRVGIDYAGPDAFLPWRFSIKGNQWISR